MIKDEGDFLKRSRFSIAANIILASELAAHARLLFKLAAFVER